MGNAFSRKGEALKLFPWRKRLFEAMSKDRSAGLDFESISNILVMRLPQDITELLEADLYKTLQHIDENIHIWFSDRQPSEEFRLAFAKFSTRSTMQYARTAVNKLDNEISLAITVYDHMLADVLWQDLIALASASTTGHAGDIATTNSSDHLVLQRLLEVEELMKHGFKWHTMRAYWSGYLIINLPQGTQDLSRHISTKSAGIHIHIFPPNSTNLVDAFVTGLFPPETNPFGEKGLFKSPVIVKAAVKVHKKLHTASGASIKDILLANDGTIIHQVKVLGGRKNTKDVALTPRAS